MTDCCAHPESFLEILAAEIIFFFFSNIMEPDGNLLVVPKAPKKYSTAVFFSRKHDPATQVVHKKCGEQSYWNYFLATKLHRFAAQNEALYIYVIWGVNCHFKDFIQTLFH